MSVEAVNQFLQQVSEDQKLQEDLAQTLESEDNDRAAATELGARYGYEFTPDELAQEIQNRKGEVQQRQQAGELSDEELEAVAGGELVAATVAASTAIATALIPQIPNIKW